MQVCTCVVINYGLPEIKRKRKDPKWNVGLWVPFSQTNWHVLTIPESGIRELRKSRCWNNLALKSCSVRDTRMVGSASWNSVCERLGKRDGEIGWELERLQKKERDSERKGEREREKWWKGECFSPVCVSTLKYMTKYGMVYTYWGSVAPCIAYYRNQGSVQIFFSSPFLPLDIFMIALSFLMENSYQGCVNRH